MKLVTLVAVTIAALPIASAGNTLPMIMNVSVETDADTIRITYDVDDPEGDSMSVLLRFAGADGGVDGPVTGIGGDIGPGVLTGTAKVIAIDRSEAAGLPEPFIPRLLAHDGTEARRPAGQIERTREGRSHDVGGPSSLRRQCWIDDANGRSPGAKAATVKPLVPSLSAGSRAASAAARSSQ